MDDDGESVKEKKGYKNFFESVFVVVGLGGVVKVLIGKDKDKDDKFDIRSCCDISCLRLRLRFRFWFIFCFWGEKGKGEGVNKI